MKYRVVACAVAAICFAQPAAAQADYGADSEQSDPSADASAEYFALDQRMGELFDIDRFEDAARRSTGFAALARDVATARAKYADQAVWKDAYAEKEGVAWYYAAEAHDYEPGDDAAEQTEIAYLTASLSALDAAVAAATQPVGPSYEYSQTTTALAELGRARNDTRWTEWSAARVRAARFRVRVLADDAGESSLLAEALYDHGWLTQDKALLAEADRIAVTIPPEAASADLDYKHQAVAAGKAPYQTPGTRSNW